MLINDDVKIKNKDFCLPQVLRNMDFRMQFSKFILTHTDYWDQNQQFLRSCHNLSKDSLVLDLYDRYLISEHNWYLKLILRNIYRPSFLSIASFRRSGQIILHTQQTPWLNINLFQFQLFRKSERHLDDEVIWESWSLYLYAQHLSYL